MFYNSLVVILVIFVDDIEKIQLEKWGAILEVDKIFPDRCNIEFAQIVNDHTIRMRVWERGSGETLACGTGACATVTAAAVNGISPMNENVNVHLRGGILTINYTGEKVLMTGTAEFAFDGEVEI